MKFIEKLNAISKKNSSLVCVGLDSDFSRIPQFIKDKYENPIWEFNKRIIDATKDQVAAYKPNFAFYVSQGEMGLAALRKTISHIPAEIPIILDVKVGDIGNTMEMYGKSYFETYEVDAITANPLMGFDVVNALQKFRDKYIFLLILTSNKSNTDFLNDEDELFKKICEKINQWGMDNIGGVVGATNGDEIQQIRNLLPQSVFLIPGIGAQGGDIGNVMKNAVAKNFPGIVINSSRSIIFADSGKDFAEAAREATIKLKGEINKYL